MLQREQLSTETLTSLASELRSSEEPSHVDAACASLALAIPLWLATGYLPQCMSTDMVQLMADVATSHPKVRVASLYVSTSSSCTDSHCSLESGSFSE